MWQRISSRRWTRPSTLAGQYLPEFQQDIGYNVDGKYYTILYEFGFNALCYRTDQLSEKDVSSYAILSDPTCHR